MNMFMTYKSLITVWLEMLAGRLVGGLLKLWHLADKSCFPIFGVVWQLKYRQITLKLPIH